MKKTLIATLTIVMVLCNGIVAFASPEQMPDGQIFDAEYYATNNPDVATALGNDKNALYQHYITFGMNEGRLPYDNATAKQDNPVPSAYKNRQCEGLRNLPEALYKDNMYIKEMIECLDNGKPTARYTYGGNNKLYGWDSYEYNADGNLTALYMHNADGSISSTSAKYEYDANGNLVNLKTEYNYENIFEYDANGRLTRNGKRAFQYGADGRLTKAYVLNDDGSISDFYTSTFEYDKNGRLSKEDYVSFPRYITYEYDANGNLIGKYRRNKGDGSVEWSAISVTWGWVREEEVTTTYKYDANGRRIAEYTYNSNNEIKDTIAYEYDANGNLIKKIFVENVGTYQIAYYVYEYGSN